MKDWAWFLSSLAVLLGALIKLTSIFLKSTFYKKYLRQSLNAEPDPRLMCVYGSLFNPKGERIGVQIRCDLLVTNLTNEPLLVKKSEIRIKGKKVHGKILIAEKNSMKCDFQKIPPLETVRLFANFELYRNGTILKDSSYLTQLWLIDSYGNKRCKLNVKLSCLDTLGQ